MRPHTHIPPIHRPSDVISCHAFIFKVIVGFVKCYWRTIKKKVRIRYWVFEVPAGYFLDQVAGLIPSIGSTKKMYVQKYRNLV